MHPEDEDAINAEMLEGLRRNRAYAGFFEWAMDRDLAEYGVVESLAKSLQSDDALFFSDLAIRGRRNDPPDLEAVDRAGNRMAIEVTELVDGDAIRASEKGHRRNHAAWGRKKFLSALGDRLAAKNARFDKLKGAPYSGGYVVVMFTDEMYLPRPTVEDI